MSGLHTGPWTLAELAAGKVGLKKNGLKVFSCFHCGGGSTMGYKLAGFDVLGGVEIDPQMMRIYQKNHSPRYSFMMPIQKFKEIPDAELNKELFDLDVLDGSPPCSSFSMAGSREDAWGTEKKFREGQAEQRLDDLFFHFIDVAKKLRPKIVVAENVKGMLVGNARGYVAEINRELSAAGYDVKLYCLKASDMGVPQNRERVFFIGLRKDLKLKHSEMGFNEKPIPIRTAFEGCETETSRRITPRMYEYWKVCGIGKSLSTVHPKKSFFNWFRLDPDRPGPTLASGSSKMLLHWIEPRCLSNAEFVRLQSFPDDYDFLDADAGYVCGMSVPPLMVQRIAARLAKILNPSLL